MDFNPDFSFPAGATAASANVNQSLMPVRHSPLLDAPAAAVAPPPPRRGAHVHRRSAAMSEDLRETLFGPLLKASLQDSPVLPHQPPLETGSLPVSSNLWDMHPSPPQQRHVYFAEPSPSPTKAKASLHAVPSLGLQPPTPKQQHQSKARSQSHGYIGFAHQVSLSPLAGPSSEPKHSRKGSIAEFISRKKNQLLGSSRSARRSTPPPSISSSSQITMDASCAASERRSVESQRSGLGIFELATPITIAQVPIEQTAVCEPAIDLNDALSPSFASLSPSKRHFIHRHSDSVPAGLHSPFQNSLQTAVKLPITPVVEEEDEEAVVSANNSSDDSHSALTQEHWKMAHRRLGSELATKSHTSFRRSPELASFTPNLASLSIPEYGSPDSEYSVLFNDSPASSSHSELGNAIAVSGRDVFTRSAFNENSLAPPCSEFSSAKRFEHVAPSLDNSRPAYA